MPRKKSVHVTSQPTPRKPLATPPEVADFIRKPVKTLTEWRYRGIGPAWTKVGGDVRYDWDDVLAWLGEQRHESTRSA